MKSLHKKLFLFIFSFVLYIAISSVTPPFMSPDEPHHFSRAYLLTNGVITLNNNDGFKSGGYIDKSLNDSFEIFNNGHVGKISNSMMLGIDMKNWGDNKVYKEIPNTAFYFPAVYIPQSIGIMFGKAFNLSILDTYKISRFLAFITCISIIIYANSIYRIPALALCVMVMPMMLFQFIATTIDGITTSLSVLMMCLLARGAMKKEIGDTCLIFISFIAFILVSSRANLIPVLILPFIAAYYSQSKIRLLPPFFAAVLSLGWIGLTISITVDGGVNHPGISQGEVIAYYLKHPFEILSIIYNTISDYGRSSFYFKSFVGKLGWLDIWMPTYLYIVSFVVIVALISLSISYSEIKKHIFFSLSVAIVSLGSAALIFCALLVQYSKFPTDVIIGIQGRYFVIPVIISAFLLMSQNKKKQMIAYIITVIMLIVSLNAMIPSIITRYYM
ncbi:DUF2142 domain-containing protein [Escherichia coli]|uniref:DUF2142 domain-containing protein n=2 Tax=Escherichia coli TaxID=562 RepID=UPI0001FB86D1|nr:DUF2142 domain-containing protein [Escherichia coli]EEV2753871.1 DUF2142 domain-containing protein [Escherichia coli O139]EFG1517148.1 DUF2142 domain-containing protein [Escherichia coli]EFG7942917.1 DUF2142 domain-containing protein [Escherichia coli]EFG8103172.1 DUF2142 domain-containing protein [Escherichia coli]EFI6538600.1 DUF2142 domain-containing protein [Escherichia coli]